MANSSERGGRSGADAATATEARPATTAETPEPDAADSAGPLHDMTNGARDVADQMRSVAGDISNQLPTMAAATRDVVGQAAHQIESSSTESLMAGTMLSLGLALGLLLGGANRILVAFALIPAAAMGATLLDRQSRSGGTSRTGSR